MQYKKQSHTHTQHNILQIASPSSSGPPSSFPKDNRVICISTVTSSAISTHLLPPLLYLPGAGIPNEKQKEEKRNMPQSTVDFTFFASRILFRFSVNLGTRQKNCMGKLAGCGWKTSASARVVPGTSWTVLQVVDENHHKGPSSLQTD